MRILMVTQFYSPTVGGQERVVEDLSHELIERGHHVVVVALQQGDLPPVSDVDGVRVYRIASTAARFFPGYADPVAANTIPSCASTASPAHAFTPPEILYASFGHVSYPNSPGCGIVWKVHTCFPVCALNARISPGGSFRYTRRSPTPFPRITRSL